MRAVPLLPLTAMLALLAPASALAIDAAEAGVIAGEIEEKEAAIKKEFGDRNQRDMSADEKRAYDQKMRAARSEVLEKHGTSERDYATGTLKLGRGGMKEMQESKKNYREARAAEAKKTAAPEKKEGEVKVQRGFDDKNPVVTDDRGGVQVQRGGGEDGIEIPVAPPAGGK